MQSRRPDVIIGAMPLPRLVSTAAVAALAASTALVLAGACSKNKKTTGLAAAGSTGDDGSGTAADSSSDTGVRHLRVKVDKKGSKFASLIDRLSGKK